MIDPVITVSRQREGLVVRFYLDEDSAEHGLNPLAVLRRTDVQLTLKVNGEPRLDELRELLERIETAWRRLHAGDDVADVATHAYDDEDGHLQRVPRTDVGEVLL